MRLLWKTTQRWGKCCTPTTRAMKAVVLGGGRQWQGGCHVLPLRVWCLKFGGFQSHVRPVISQWFVGGIAFCDLKQACIMYTFITKPVNSVLSRREKVTTFQTNPQTPLKHWDAVEDSSGRFEFLEFCSLLFKAECVSELWVSKQTPND